MAIKYFQIKEKPNSNGFAVKIDTDTYMKKNLENFSSENPFFEKIKEDENYSHFKLIEEDYYVLKDKIADAATIKKNPFKLNKGRGNLANVCLNESGKIRIYNNKHKLLVTEISQSKAYSIKRNTEKYRRKI